MINYIWKFLNNLVGADTLFSMFQLTRWIGSEDWYILMGYASMTFYSVLTYTVLRLVHLIINAPVEAANAWRLTRNIANIISFFPKSTSLACYLSLLGAAYGVTGIATNCYYESFPDGSRELADRNFLLNHFVCPRENEVSKSQWDMLKDQKARMPQCKIDEMNVVIKRFKLDLNLFKGSKLTPEALKSILRIYLPFAPVVAPGTGKLSIDNVIRDGSQKFNTKSSRGSSSWEAVGKTQKIEITVKQNWSLADYLLSVVVIGIVVGFIFWYFDMYNKILGEYKFVPEQIAKEYSVENGEHKPPITPTEVLEDNQDIPKEVLEGNQDLPESNEMRYFLGISRVAVVEFPSGKYPAHYFSEFVECRDVDAEEEHNGYNGDSKMFTDEDDNEAIIANDLLADDEEDDLLNEDDEANGANERFEEEDNRNNEANDPLEEDNGDTDDLLNEDDNEANIANDLLADDEEDDLLNEDDEANGANERFEEEDNRNNEANDPLEEDNGDTDDLLNEDDNEANIANERFEEEDNRNNEANDPLEEDNGDTDDLLNEDDNEANIANDLLADDEEDDLLNEDDEANGANERFENDFFYRRRRAKGDRDLG